MKNNFWFIVLFLFLAMSVIVSCVSGPLKKTSMEKRIDKQNKKKNKKGDTACPKIDC